MPRPDAFPFHEQLLILGLPDGLALHGCCDTNSALQLDSALNVLRTTRREPTHLDLAHVSFADSRGLEPIAEHIRWCRLTGRIEPTLTAPSEAVTRVFRALDVRWTPFDLDAWDRAGRPRSRLRASAITEPDGGERFRGEVLTPVPSNDAPSADATNTFIATTHQCERCAAMEVRGVLDLSAGVLLASMPAGHARAQRKTVFVDTFAATRIDSAVSGLLAQAGLNASVKLVVSPLGMAIARASGIATTT